MIIIFTMTTGTMFLMWIGEQITERGIGNGMSLIITIGILILIPTAIGTDFATVKPGFSRTRPDELFFCIGFRWLCLLLSLLLRYLIIQGHRRIPLQYARRVVGRKEVQGGTSYIPLKINYAGVIPVIFASSFLCFLQR